MVGKTCGNGMNVAEQRIRVDRYGQRDTSLTRQATPRRTQEPQSEASANKPMVSKPVGTMIKSATESEPIS